MAKKCSKCSHISNDDNNQFCQLCGSSMIPIAPGQSQYEPNEPKKQSDLRTVFIAIFVVILTAGGIFIGNTFANKNQEVKNQKLELEEYKQKEQKGTTDALQKEYEDKTDAKIRELEEKSDAKIKESEEKADAKIKESEQKTEEKLKESQQSDNSKTERVVVISNYDSYLYLGDGYFFADSNWKELTNSQLKNLSLEDLGFVRNEIYARYGYNFKTEAYNNYFLQKSWYYRCANNDNIKLNDVEIKNVDKIKEYEAAKKK